MRFGDFEVIDTAGAGATGTVYRARDVRSGAVVAVKVVSPDAVARLEQEAATLRRLQHPHVVRLLDTGTANDGRPWLAQAWVDGVGLDRLLQVHGSLTAEQAVGVVRGAVEGLAHAHDQRLVHGDVAPANVLVDTTGTSMLVDFGIAAPVGATGVRGTPAFLSPEAAAGAAVGPASDVYSAGAVLHLLLAGQPVFPAADVVAVIEAHRATPPPRLHGHGKGFADLLQRCLAKEPDARPPDAGALLAELDETADRRFGAGWLARASVAALVPTARVAGSGTAGTQAAGAARETVVLTTGAVSTGAAAAAAPAPAASTAPAAAQAPVQPPAPPSAPRRLRVPKTGPAIAATAVIAVAVIAAGTTAVVALTGNDPSTEDGTRPDPSVTAAPAVGGCPESGATTEGALFLDPPCGSPGTVVTASGTGCADTNLGPDGRDGRIGFYVDPTGNFSGAQQTSFDVSPDGSWTVTFTVPEAEPGEHPVEVACDSPAPALSSFSVIDEEGEDGSADGAANASYSGTMRSTSAGDGRTTESTEQLGVSCSDACILTGINLVEQPVLPLTREGAGRFRLDLPRGPGDPCTSFVPRAITGTVVLTGDSMTFEATSPTFETTCGESAKAIEYGQTYSFTGTLVDGEPILD